MSVLVGSAAGGAALLALHAALNARLLRRAPVPPPPSTELVSVLVPARDEARRIGACVTALLASEGVAFELLVGDDGSTDGTADVVRRVAAGDRRVRVLTANPPLPGWLGKPSVCAQLAAAARGPVLAFVDADVVVEPGALAAAVALLRTTPLDLVSPYPRQLADGPAPRLVQPLLQWSWLTFLPLRLAERLPFPSLTAANGQLLVCDAGWYRSAGGHGAVRDAVLDDVELARAFKAAGGRVGLADGTRLATCRMYEDWAGLREGYTKSLWAAFGSPAGAAAVAGLFAWLYLLPPLAALLARRPRTAALGAAGYLAAVLGRAATAHATGARLADTPAHPLSVAAFCYLLARSWHARRTGTLTWKGRVLG